MAGIDLQAKDNTSAFARQFSTGLTAFIPTPYPTKIYSLEEVYMDLHSHSHNVFATAMKARGAPVFRSSVTVAPGAEGRCL